MAAQAGASERRRRRSIMAALGALSMICAAIFVCALLVPGQTAYALTSSNSSWEYTLDDAGKATITAYHDKNKVSDLDIPSSLDGHEVVGIASSVFADDTKLVNVYFPSSITKLGGSLFGGCTKLESVSLTPMEELAVIPDSCFYGCTSLASVTIPACVVIISDNAFEGCTNLATVRFQSPSASNLEYIGPGAFKDCSALGAIEFPLNLEMIGNEAFANCYSMRSVTFLGQALTTIGYEAFAGCSALPEIFFPDSLDSIQEYAFKNCFVLEVVGYGKHLPTTVAADVYDGCEALKMMVFPSGSGGTAPSLNDMVRAGYSLKMAYLTVYYFEDGTVGINRIHPSAFVKSITLPATVGRRAVTAITDGAAYQQFALEEVIIPDDCEIFEIGWEAFKGCTSLTSFTIPKSVRKMEYSVFNGCTALESVVFETSSIDTIEASTFMNCTSLKEIKFPEGVKTIASHACYNCTALTSVYLPDSLTLIGEDAFVCDHGSTMAIEVMRMPDSLDELGVPADHAFMVNWNWGKVKFKVTYGSWWDAVWFENHKANHTVEERHRVYEAVPIDDTDECTAKFTWDKECAYDGGNQVFPTVTGSRWLRSELVLGKDFSLTAAAGYDCSSVGQQKAVITGLSPRFTGTKTIDYQITGADIKDAVADPIPDCVWDDDEWCPGDGEKWSPDLVLKMTFGDAVYTLEKGKDYTIDGYSDNSDVGQATITVLGKGAFVGKTEIHFNIVPSPLGDAKVIVPDQTYTGAKLEPKPDTAMLRDRSGTYTHDLDITEGRDYTLTYEDANTVVGTGSVTLEHIEGSVVSGSKKVEFNILPADLSKATVAPVADQVYTGSAIEPKLSVSAGAGKLQQGVDYTVSWQKNKDVGTAKGTVSGKAPNCIGSQTVEFKIVPKPVTVTADDKQKAFGDDDPALTAAVEGVVDGARIAYTLARKAGEMVGKYPITVSGEAAQGNYAVSFRNGVFSIVPASIEDAAIAKIPDAVFDGGAHEPAPIVTWRGQTLVKGTDYDVEYADNVHAGMATVTVKGKGNFQGRKSASFTIEPLDIAGGECKVFVPFKVHTGSPLEPHPGRVSAPGRDGATLVLVDGTDFAVAGWRDNVNVGTGYVSIEGRGDYCGTREDPFNIVNDGDLSQGYMDAIPDQTYTGGPIEPALRVYLNGVDLWLIRDVDYTAVFEDNVNAGREIPGGVSRARVTVTGIGDLHGSIEGSFRIAPASISEVGVAVDAQMYDGTAHEPDPVVTWNEMILDKGTDYEISYKSNVHAGTATVVVAGKGNFIGETAGTFDILRRPATVTADSASKEYDGTALAADGFTAKGIAAGDTVASAKVVGSQTDAGRSANVVSGADIRNADGDAVAADYDLSYAQGVLKVTPYSTRVEVAITGNDASATYDGEKHAVRGYKVSIDDRLYREADIAFEGTASVEAVQAGTYPMGLAKADFSNASGNFADVAFTVDDGSLVIDPADLGDSGRFSIDSLEDVAYDGSAHKPKPTVHDAVTGTTLEEGSDYRLDYENNVEPGTAAVIVSGRGNYTGKRTAAFNIREVVYTLVSGPDGSVKQGSGAVAEFVFKRSVDDETTLDHLRSVAIDGKVLDPSAYATRRGSAVITLGSAYIDKMDAGAHTLEAIFDDGRAQAAFKVAGADPKPNNGGTAPSTGDPISALPVCAALLLSTVLLVLGTVKLRAFRLSLTRSREIGSKR